MGFPFKQPIDIKGDMEPKKCSCGSKGELEADYGTNNYGEDWSYYIGCTECNKFISSCWESEIASTSFNSVKDMAIILWNRG